VRAVDSSPSAGYLQQYRQDVQQRFKRGSTPPEPLDTTALAASPIRRFNAEAERDLVYSPKPLGQALPPLKQASTPAESRGNYKMVDQPGLHISVDLGPMLWQHTERGEGLGRHLDVFA
jgi:hypothetical protein